MKLFDTQLPAAFSKTLYEEKCADLAAEHTDKIFDVAFTGTANLLNNAKSMDKPCAFKFVNVTDGFIVGCIVQYFANSDDSNPGNWNMVWTFDEKDIDEDKMLVLDINQPQTHSYFRAYSGNKYGMVFQYEGSLEITTGCAFEQLKKWLDENAKEGEEVTIECDGIFQARVAVENGEKVFALEADGEIKNLIKDDAAIEK